MGLWVEAIENLNSRGFFSFLRIFLFRFQYWVRSMPPIPTPAGGGGRWSHLGRQLCKRVINIDTREDSMGAVWTYIEYGWNLNPEVGLKNTKSELNNSISVDGIDMLPAVVLVQLAG